MSDFVAPVPSWSNSQDELRHPCLIHGSPLTFLVDTVSYKTLCSTIACMMTLARRHPNARERWSRGSLS